jgi:hypothetical protein
MSESQTQTKAKAVRRKNQPTYKHRTNAVHLTLYSVDGTTIPAAVRREAEAAITEIALRSGCLVGIATT